MQYVIPCQRRKKPPLKNLIIEDQDNKELKIKVLSLMILFIQIKLSSTLRYTTSVRCVVLFLYAYPGCKRKGKIFSKHIVMMLSVTSWETL